jgi:hypothetical protein
MVKLLNRLLGYIWCDHQWRYVDTVQDQDLRSGYKFWSERHVCRRCGRTKTTELLNRPR